MAAEYSNHIAGELINDVLQKETTSSNLQTALALAVIESGVKLPAELRDKLVAIQAAGDIPLCPSRTDPEDIRIKAEALRMIFQSMIIFIMAYARSQTEDNPIEKRIKQIAQRYGIKAPWEEDVRENN